MSCPAEIHQNELEEAYSLANSLLLNLLENQAEIDDSLSYALNELENLILEYNDMWEAVKQFQEVTKHKYISKVAVENLSDYLEKFEKNLKDYSSVLALNMKTDCSELISRNDLEQLLAFASESEKLAEKLQIIFKAFDALKDDFDDELVTIVKDFKRRVDAIISNINLIETNLIELQKQVINKNI